MPRNDEFAARQLLIQSSIFFSGQVTITAAVGAGGISIPSNGDPEFKGTIFLEPLSIQVSLTPGAAGPGGSE